MFDGMMKIEFLNYLSSKNSLEEGFANKIMRLYDFDFDEANKFKRKIQQFMLEKNKSLVLSEIDFIKKINCNLIFRIGETNIGITTSDNKNFFCDLTIEEYKNMVELIEPFCIKNNNGYQWLYDIDTPIEFLFSHSGKW